MAPVTEERLEHEGRHLSRTVLPSSGSKDPHIDALVRSVAELFRAPIEEVLTRSRIPTRLDARRVVMWVVFEAWRPKPSFSEVGRILGYRHDVVSDAVKYVDEAIKEGSELGDIAVVTRDALPSTPPWRSPVLRPQIRRMTPLALRVVTPALDTADNNTPAEKTVKHAD